MDIELEGRTKMLTAYLNYIIYECNATPMNC